MNRFELPEERLATTDEKGHRVLLYPADVRGYFHNLRRPIHAVMLIIFMVLPWIKIGGHQAVLLNIAERRFALFGLTFWSHDAPILFFILAGAAFTIAFITAIWGRIWCGWACPETVFTEAVFRRIERWIEGDHVKRLRRDQGPWNSEKILKKSLKWLVFTAVALVIAHSFLAYFVGTDELMKMVQSSPSENMTPFTIMAFATAVVLFFFGWFREQFCIIVCPYGRLQSVLLDENSLLIHYDEKRGEPRKTHEHHENHGDCINCYRCVQVCPTGVDIRRGLQMECVACSACIDACDEIMDKINKPRGLIRYDSKSGKENRKGKSLRSRTIVYMGIILLMLGGLIWSVGRREMVDFEILRGRGNPFQMVKTSDGNQRVINRYKIDFGNQSFESVRFTIGVHPDDAKNGLELITAEKEISIESGKQKLSGFFLRFPKDILNLGKAKVRVRVNVLGLKTGEREVQDREVSIIGPFK